MPNYKDLFGNERFSFVYPTGVTIDEETGAPKSFKGVAVSKTELLAFFALLGYYRINIDGAPYLIKKKDNIITPVEPIDLQDEFFPLLTVKFMADHLHPAFDQAYHLNQIKDKLYNGLATYFDKNFLYRNHLHPVQFTSDGPAHSWRFFNDCALKITAKGIERIKYSKLPGFVWSSQIIDRKAPKGDEDTSAAMFHRFVGDISSRPSADEKGWQPDPERIEQLQSIMGYMCHSFYNRELKLPMLIDSSVDESPNGRTGKTLLGKAIGHFLNGGFQEINGKDFDTQDPGRYRDCGPDTKAIHINDVRRYFNVEPLFNDITEGIKIKKLYMEPVAQVVKIMASTNMSIDTTGGSRKDRLWIFELAQYYSHQYSPAQKFGAWFFRDWSAEEWQLFDSYMCNCLQVWLQKEFCQSRSIVAEQKAILEQTNRDFVDFLESAPAEDQPAGQIYNLLDANAKADDVELDTAEEWHGGYYTRIFMRGAFEEFCTQYGKDGKYFYQQGRRSVELKPPMFNKWLKLYVEYKPEFYSTAEAKSFKRELKYKSKGDQAFVFALKV